MVVTLEQQQRPLHHRRHQQQHHPRLRGSGVRSRGGCGGAHFNWLDHLDAVGSGIYRLLDEVSRPRAQDAVSPVGCMLVGRVRARQPDPSLRVCWLGDSDSE